MQGNRNWMRAREALLASDLIPGDLERLYPICTPGRAATPRRSTRCSSCCTSAAASLPHAVLMMIPEAWENHAEMDAAAPGVLRVPRLADGAVGRPGLRGASPTAPRSARCSTATACGPSRYWVTDDGLVVLASEVGVLDIDPAKVVRKGRLQPGRMFLVDTDEHRIIEDDEIKGELAAEHPYDEWLHAGHRPARRPARPRARRAHATPR